MRIMFGVLGLLVVLATLGWLGKTQLQSLPRLATPAGAAASAAAADAPAQARAIQQSIKDDVNKLMQAPPDRGEPKP